MTTIDQLQRFHQPILEEGCIKTGAICKFPDGWYALGDLYHYGSPGVIIFRHGAPISKPPRDYLNGHFESWEHQWNNEPYQVLIARDSDFQYFGYEGKQI